MKIVKDKWAAADKAYAKGVQAYIEWGRALAEIDATQEEIAARYEVDQPEISKAISVGADQRFMANGHNPKSTKSLYLLTTLDDKAFKELCKPETTQADILAYKKRLAPPLKPNPVKMVEEVNLQELMDEEREERQNKEGGSSNYRVITKTVAPIKSWGSIEEAFEDCKDKTIADGHVMKILGITRKELIRPALNYYTSKHHPDVGGATEIMTFLNEIRSISNGS